MNLPRHLPCFLILILALLGATGCDRQHHGRKSRGKIQMEAPEKKIKKVHYDRQSGRYYYAVHTKTASGDDSWLYYWLIEQNTAYCTPDSTQLSASTLASGIWSQGSPPAEYATQPPTEQEISSASEPSQDIEVGQAQTQENLGIPEPNSLDSMEGVPESSETGMDSAGDTSGGESGTGDSSSSDSGGGDSGGGDSGGGDSGGGE